MKLFSLLILYISLTACNKETVPSIGGRVEIENFKSKLVNENYKLYFYTPANFDQFKSYDIIFQLDADYQFYGLVNTIETLVSQKKLDQKILVGVGYSGADMRERDYTFKINNSNFEGGAPKFHDFLKEELIPFVQNKFICDSTKYTIVGHSLGGLFVYYALFNNSDSTFSNFISQSPSLWWNGADIFKLEANSKFSNSKLYSNIGEFENSTMRSLFEEMRKRINNPKYQNIKSKFSVIQMSTHTRTKINNYEAYEFIFN